MTCFVKLLKHITRSLLFFSYILLATDGTPFIGVGHLSTYSNFHLHVVVLGTLWWKVATERIWNYLYNKVYGQHREAMRLNLMKHLMLLTMWFWSFQLTRLDIFRWFMHVIDIDTDLSCSAQVSDSLLRLLYCAKMTSCGDRSICGSGLCKDDFQNWWIRRWRELEACPWDCSLWT